MFIAYYMNVFKVSMQLSIEPSVIENLHLTLKLVFFFFLTRLEEI